MLSLNANGLTPKRDYFTTKEDRTHFRYRVAFTFFIRATYLLKYVSYGHLSPVITRRRFSGTGAAVSML